jgi:PiT family inorganic phosphate transporter
MYLTSEALRLIEKDKTLGYNDEEKAALDNYKGKLDKATKYIPDWVKVAVALALGLGTMVGWKRIVITVGERIGKSHMTYAQGAIASFVTMATIAVFDRLGLPVSTTHLLSSGVAGTMAANKSGLQLKTLHRIASTWVLTLPAAALLSGSLFWIFRHFTH